MSAPSTLPALDWAELPVELKEAMTLPGEVLYFLFKAQGDLGRANKARVKAVKAKKLDEVARLDGELPQLCQRVENLDTLWQECRAHLVELEVKHGRIATVFFGAFVVTAQAILPA